MVPRMRKANMLWFFALLFVYLLSHSVYYLPHDILHCCGGVYTSHIIKRYNSSSLYKDNDILGK